MEVVRWCSSSSREGGVKLISESPDASSIDDEIDIVDNDPSLPRVLFSL